MSEISSNPSAQIINPRLISDIISAMKFKLIHNVADLDNEEIVFKPKLSHLIFDDDENVYGYEDLEIKIYYTAASLKPYLNVTFSNKMEDATPPDIEKTIVGKFNCQFETDLEKFKQEIEEEVKFSPVGQKIYEFNVPKNTGSDSDQRSFEIYLATNETTDFPAFHFRIETLTLWFIDGANLIDAEDKLWNTFYIVEKLGDGDSTKYSFAGFGNVYEFYCYPDKIRPRISQVLILPPFLRNGLCAQLLKTIQMHYAKNPLCRNITYEDPSEELMRVRWFVDASMCAALPSFDPRRMTNRCDPHMIDEVEKKLKLSHNVVRTAFEILRLLFIEDEPSELREFRAMLQRRIMSEHKVARNPFTLPETDEDAMELALEAVEDLIGDYKKVIHRMKNHPLVL